jgi:hypothetical protein
LKAYTEAVVDRLPLEKNCQKKLPFDCMTQKAKPVSGRLLVEAVVMFSSTKFCAIMNYENFNSE